MPAYNDGRIVSSRDDKARQVGGGFSDRPEISVPLAHDRITCINGIEAQLTTARKRQLKASWAKVASRYMHVTSCMRVGAESLSVSREFALRLLPTVCSTKYKTCI